MHKSKTLNPMANMLFTTLFRRVSLYTKQVKIDALKQRKKCQSNIYLHAYVPTVCIIKFLPFVLFADMFHILSFINFLLNLMTFWMGPPLELKQNQTFRQN